MALVLKCRRGKFLAMFALKCSSFSCVNAGTSQRSPCYPLGNSDYKSVMEANGLAERTGLSDHPCRQCYIYISCRTLALIMLVTTLGGTWVLEQPRGSSFEFYPTFMDVCMNLYIAAGGSAVACLDHNCVHVCFLCLIESAGLLPKVFKVSWWMAHYMSRTPKRHYAYSNSAAVGAIDKGVLQGWKKRSEKTKVRTAEKYVDGKGKKRWKENRNLKATERLAL